VFQRTPPWLLPVPNYQQDLPDGMRWMLRHLPEYARWDRLWVFWRTHESILAMAVVDPEWPDKERSVSASNELLRQIFTMYYEIVFPDPELREKVLPKYPPIAKRVVLDDGALPAAYQRPNVTVVTTAIERIEPDGVVTTDGTLHDFDVLIFGTGFHASKFLTPIQLTGVGGVDLHERWAGDARAYLGIVVPEFPNLFLMYGPNTNIVINGSIIYFSECEAHFIVQSLRMLLERGLHAMNCKSGVHDSYNEWIDAGNQSMAWGVSSVNSWYKNELGRVAQNWPYSLLEYWQQTREPNPDDFILT
jgi:4-hydroxyacetophenone monooxygenase